MDESIIRCPAAYDSPKEGEAMFVKPEPPQALCITCDKLYRDKSKAEIALALAAIYEQAANIIALGA